MLLYNEDILDILDQGIYLELGMVPRYNCGLAYVLSPYVVTKELRKIMKKLKESKDAN